MPRVVRELAERLQQPVEDSDPACTCQVPGSEFILLIMQTMPGCFAAGWQLWRPVVPAADRERGGDLLRAHP